MGDFISMRLVQVFGDKSELVLLTASNSYVWQRPVADGRILEEVPIVAGDDVSALAEVRRISELEYANRMLGGPVSTR